MGKLQPLSSHAMLTIKKILFPTDFSACAEHAYGYASDLAETFDAEIHVLNVIGREGKRGSQDPITYIEEGKDSGTVPGLHRAARPKDKTKFVQDESHSEVKSILEYARTNDADVIVMGTHGRTGLSRLILGSVAENVVRLARCPVLTVRPVEEDAEEHRTIRRIVVPTDFSKHANEALRHAIEFASVWNAEVVLQHVITEAVFPGVYGVERIQTTSAAVQWRVREALRRELDKFDARGVMLTESLLMGIPSYEIVRFAQDNDVDLIVTSTHGHTGIERMLMGSVAEHVVRRSPCPVLILKSFGKSLMTTNAASHEASAPLPAG